MLFYVISLGLLALATAQTKYCCFPNEFSAHEAQTGMGYREHHSHLIEGRSVISYDYNNKRISIQEILDIDGNPVTNNFRMVGDYTKGLMYYIKGSNCSTFTMNGFMRERCIPDFATHLGTSFFGIQGEELFVESYVFTAVNNTVFQTVTKGDCYPVTMSISGENRGVPHMMSINFNNIIPGISDVSVFDILPNCPTTPSGTFIPGITSHPHHFGDGHGTHIPVGK